jgi:hypothetical protein
MRFEQIVLFNRLEQWFIKPVNNLEMLTCHVLCMVSPWKFFPREIALRSRKGVKKLTTFVSNICVWLYIPNSICYPQIG